MVEDCGGAESSRAEELWAAAAAQAAVGSRVAAGID